MKPILAIFGLVVFATGIVIPDFWQGIVLCAVGGGLIGFATA